MKLATQILVLGAVAIPGAFSGATSTQIDCNVTQTDTTKTDQAPKVDSVRLDVWAISKQSESVSKEVGTLDGKQIELMAYVSDEATQALTLQLNEKVDDTNSTLMASASVPETGNFVVMYRSLSSETLVELACNASATEELKPTPDEVGVDPDAAPTVDADKTTVVTPEVNPVEVQPEPTPKPE